MHWSHEASGHVTKSWELENPRQAKRQAQTAFSRVIAEGQIAKPEALK